MYNTNVSVSGPPLLAVESGPVTTGTMCGTTPRTPEILNSLMAMTNPLEYSYPGGAQTNQQVSQLDSHSSCSGSPLDSPAGTATTPSVQQTCSQLIRAGLKLSLEMKRKTSTGDSSGTENCKITKLEREYLDSSDDDMDSKSSKSGLTAEDEDRRRRRRERNKIAATKCRMKKRERTLNLVSESEVLETQNVDLKTQVRNLEMERRTLSEMLQAHGQTCMRQGSFQPPVCNVSVTKYLTDLGLGATSIGQSNGETPSKGGRSGSSKSSQQKIPSMNTLKFNGNQGNRRSHTQTRMGQMIHHLDTSTSSSAGSTPLSTPTSTSKHQQQQQHQQITSVDLGYCEGNDLNIVSEMILSQQSGGFGKALSASDCYAISSPDSGFIKSPVDITNGGYGNLATSSPVIIKSDYIPNCDNGANSVDPSSIAMRMGGHCVTPTSTSTGGGGIEFILKSELVDGSDSPYTTVQSADRFLFDGSEAFDGSEPFDADIDQTPQPHMQHHSHHLLSPQQLHQQSIKGHNMLLNNNNNNNIISNHNHNGNCNIPSVTTIHDFSHCQPYIDYSLLKGDFLGQNTEFLALAADGSDTQFTELTSTDLDSGVTTPYASITNGSGCLA